eukprot:CAMPEP_0202439950 /NCGR_PEP_ID=MMETSP1345-20130828/36434_1 /ASSEMBLY_ACC=CAM_ASM_000843 /TAXON_ID=342563 /ORGANISM="Fabrea Fabrea salina" /LENGTH=1132 /DNA_ID=CAMNT_0049054511 /DNA_START=125 /DNA_END=3523 /DNA_ORIENTATION=-
MNPQPEDLKFRDTNGNTVDGELLHHPSDSQFWFVIPSDFLRTYQTKPQLRVWIDDRLAMCDGDCSFEYQNVPVVRSFSLTSNTVTINGENFPGDASKLEVKIGSIDCRIKSNSDSSIECQLEPYTEGDYQPQVTYDGYYTVPLDPKKSEEHINLTCPGNCRCQLEPYNEGDYQPQVTYDGYYTVPLDPAKSGDYITLTCPSNCRLCTLPTNCTECFSGWDLYKEACTGVESFSITENQFTFSGNNIPENSTLLNVTIGPYDCKILTTSGTSIVCQLPSVYEKGEYQIRITIQDYGPLSYNEYAALVCPSNCRLCTLPTKCVECISNWNLYKGRCSKVCPTGFNCSETSSEIYGPEVAFEFKPQGMQKIITDPYNSIPVKAGTGTQFYPFFSDNDPYPTKERGYYFKGSSYMRLPPYESTESPILVLAWEFSVSVWFKSETLQGTILSKTSNQTKVEIGLEDSLYSTVEGTTYYSSSTLDNSWTLAMVTVSNNPKTLQERVPSVFCQTEFEDTDRDFKFVIGANATLQNFFQGFIWRVKAYKLPKNTPEFSLNCGNCTMCPVELNECLPECGIEQFWDEEQCGDCLPNCKFGCINDYSCSLCGNDLCLECEFEECSSCVGNAFINPNSTCECERGYVEEYGFCNRGTFSGSLTKEESTFTLEFTQNPASELQLEDFDLHTQNKSIKFEFTMKTLSVGKYEFSLEFKSYVSKGEVMFLDLLKSELVSTSDFLLESLSFETQLERFDPADGITKQAQESAQTTSSVTTGASGGAALLNANPAGVWAMLNTIQDLSYIPLSSNALTPTLRGHFKGLNIADRVPNVLEYTCDSSSYSNPHYYSKEYGFESNLLLLNAGRNIMVLAGLLVSWPVVWGLSKVPFLESLLTKLLKQFKYNIFIRFFIQSYFDLAIACFIQICSVPQLDRLSMNNFIAGCLGTAFLSCIPVAIILKFRTRPESTEGFSTLLDEFDWKKKPAARFTYAFFTLKRLLLTISLILLSNYPYIQGVTNSILALTYTCFIIVVRPYKDGIVQLTANLTETGKSLVFIGIIYFLQVDWRTEDGTIESAIKYISDGIVVVQSLGVVLGLIFKLYTCLRGSNDVTPVQDLTEDNKQTNVETSNHYNSSAIYQEPSFVKT